MPKTPGYILKSLAIVSALYDIHLTSITGNSFLTKSIKFYFVKINFPALVTRSTYSSFACSIVSLFIPPISSSLTTRASHSFFLLTTTKRLSELNTCSTSSLLFTSSIEPNISTSVKTPLALQESNYIPRGMVPQTRRK